MSKFNIIGSKTQIVSGKTGWAALNRAAKAEKQAKEKHGKSISGSDKNQDRRPQSNKIHP